MGFPFLIAFIHTSHLSIWTKFIENLAFPLMFCEQKRTPLHQGLSHRKARCRLWDLGTHSKSLRFYSLVTFPTVPLGLACSEV